MHGVSFHARLMVMRGLQAQQADVVNPEQGADEGVCCPHEEGESGAQARVAFEDGLYAALLNHPRNQLIPILPPQAPGQYLSWNDLPQS